MVLISAVAVAGFGVPLALSVRARNYDDALLTLSGEAATAAVVVPGSFERDGDVPELPDAAANIDVSLYGRDGRRVLGEGPITADRHVEEVLRTGAARQDRTDLVVVVPISDNETVAGAIRASIDNSAVTARTLRAWAAMAGLALGVLAIAGVIASRRSRSLALPLAQLRNAADVIGGGGELPVNARSGVPEIDSVHDALAEAATRLNAAMARERELSEDLAHQIRTPLASLRIRLETEQINTTQAGGLVSDALRDVDRLERTIDDVLTLARDSERRREPHPMATLLRETASHWGPRLLAAGRALDLDVEPSLPWVRASPQAIRQILDVLMDNAVIHGAGRVGLAASRLGQGAVVAVSDQGETAVDPARIFLRRNDEARGEGIGLALARRLADAEGLRLIVADPGPGVVFHLVFGGASPMLTDSRRRPSPRAS